MRSSTPPGIEHQFRTCAVAVQGLALEAASFKRAVSLRLASARRKVKPERRACRDLERGTPFSPSRSARGLWRAGGLRPSSNLDRCAEVCWRRCWAQAEVDLLPVVKHFTPAACATWLLIEVDPGDHDIAFGLCDLGLWFPELGWVSLSELAGVREGRRRPQCMPARIRPWCRSVARHVTRWLPAL